MAVVLRPAPVEAALEQAVDPAALRDVERLSEIELGVLG